MLYISQISIESRWIMKVLVAGGAGFIGSHLIDALLAWGNEVVCIDNLSLGKKRNIDHMKNQAKFQFYEADLCDETQLNQIFEKEAIEYVFQLAANSDIRSSASHPDIEYRNTYSTTYSLLECMRKNKVKKIFFASTSAVYGNKVDELLDEDTPGLSPVSYYGAAKLGCEALISAYSYMNDMSALIFRFPNVIGPRLTHGVVHDFILKLSANPKELEILGDGTQTKPYIYVSDLIHAIMFFKDKAAKGVTLYNVGAEGTTSVRQIADMVCQEMGLLDVSYRFTGGHTGWKGDVPKFQYSLEKVHQAGWHAQLSSDDAVRLAVKHNLQV